MSWYDAQLVEKLTNIGLRPYMFQRYVDDTNPALPEAPMGAVYQDGVLRIDEAQLESDMNTPSDERTMRIVQDVGNDIHPSIRLDIDYPSNHADGKMPLLDLKIWVNERNKIVHEFYSKSMASKYTVHERSAMAKKTKRQILTQDALRILLNCSGELPWDAKAQHLQNFSARMQFSGYNQKFRYEVIDSAVKALRKIEDAVARGERPIYRPKEWKWQEREEKKRDSKTTWFRRGGCQSVVFIPATPGSILKSKFEKEITKSIYKIRVVELSGKSLKSQLQRSNPTRNKECRREECAVCSSGGKGPCDMSGVTYEIKCDCGDMYIGQTSRNAYARGQEHFNDLRNKSGGTLWKHCTEKHDSEEKRFIMNVTGRYRDDCMLRQLSEAVRIQQERPTLNSKDEWNFVKIPRAIVIDG